MNEKTEKKPRYRCPIHGDGVVTIDFRNFETNTERNFCFECFAELVEKNIGVVEEIL